MKRLALALALFLAPAIASAQTGIFPANTVWGNATVSSAQPKATAITAFSGLFANPTAIIGLTAVNGTATTGLRSDSAPALSQAIAPTMTGDWVFAPASNNSTRIVGLGQDTGNLLDAGPWGGTVMLFDTSAVAGHGGAVLFGVNNSTASTNPMWAIKGSVANGTGPVGDLIFSGRLLGADTALTEVLRLSGERNDGVAFKVTGATTLTHVDPTSNNMPNALSVTKTRNAPRVSAVWSDQDVGTAIVTQINSGNLGTAIAAAGQVWGGFVSAFLHNAPYYGNVTGWEINVAVDATSSAEAVYGLTISHIPNHATAGSLRDIALRFEDDPAVVTGLWRTLIGVTTHTLDPSGTVLKVDSGTTLTSLIDANGTTVTGYLLRGPNLTIDGSGNVSSLSSTTGQIIVRATAANTFLYIDTTIPAATAIGLRDQGTTKWFIQKDITNTFAITDNSTGHNILVSGIGSDAVTLGVSGTNAGKLNFVNATSGTISIVPPAGALGTVTLTLPTTTTVLAGLAVAQTFSATQTFTLAPVFTAQAGTRTALGLGTAAVQNTGTSGANIPFLNGVNTWSGAQTFSAGTVMASVLASGSVSSASYLGTSYNQGGIYPVNGDGTNVNPTWVVGTNFSSGGSEIDQWNTSISPSTGGFRFIQKTGASSSIDILTVDKNGLVTAPGGFTISTAAKTITLKQGANGAVGTFVCTSGGTITITNSFVAITDAIVISLNTVGGTVSTNPTVNAITAATSFTVKCATSDTSTYNYAIIKNAAWLMERDLNPANDNYPVGFSHVA